MTQNKKYYAGVGSRDIPTDYGSPYKLALAMSARELEQLGYTLRTGCASGSDQIFRNATNVKEVYSRDSVRLNTWKIATDIAKSVHPCWHKLSKDGKILHTRNVYQILGGDLKVASEFVLCYTPDGCIDGTKTTRETGGTGQALRLAAIYNIPIVNVKNDDWIDRLYNILEKNNTE